MAETRWWRSRRWLIFAAVALVVLALGWWYTAYPRGMIAAWADDAWGHQEIKVYGLPFSFDEEYTRLLHDRYGVKVNRVAGCLVTQDLVWYVNGYNSVAMSRIKALHGKDIFTECFKEAGAAGDQAHP